MSELGKNKFIGYAVIGLAILNIALLTFIWFGFGSKKRPRPHKEGMIFLEQELNLTPEQQTKLEQLRNEHFEEMKELTKSSREARRELHNLWSKEVADDKVKSLTDQIGELQSQIERTTFNHFADVRALCNEEQSKIFDGMIKDILRQGERRGPMGGGPPPNGRPGGSPPRKLGR